MSDSIREKLDAIRARVELALQDDRVIAYVDRAEHDAEEAREAERRVRRRYSGIPESFWPVVEVPEETDAVAAVRRFLVGEWTRQDAAHAERPLVLLLAGTVGRGKTIAAAVGVDLAGGRFIDAAELVQANVYAAEWGRLFAPKVLAVDEIGAEALDEKGWGASKLYDLLNGRIQAGKLTILVTNLEPKAFVARYRDERLRDRFRAYGDVYVATGESMRGAK